MEEICTCIVQNLQFDWKFYYDYVGISQFSDLHFLREYHDHTKLKHIVKEKQKFNIRTRILQWWRVDELFF